MKKEFNVIIDFDGTFTRVEALNELANISLKNDPNRKKILKQIKDLTEKGMNGDMPFDESLIRRIKLLKANKLHLAELIDILKNKISPSFLRNKYFFQHHSDNFFIFSGGFKEFIIPVIEGFNIPDNHIFANRFVFDEDDNIVGFDSHNLMAKKDGKILQLKELDLKGDVYVIGDGYTDYQMKESGLVTKFYAFTENFERDVITKKADYVAPTFDDFLYRNRMSISYPRNRIKILLLENIHPDAATKLKKEGYQVELLKTALDEDELSEKIKDVSIIGIRSKTKITKKVLKNAHRLLAVGAFCIGTNQIDLDACLEKGVAVFNAPFSNTRSVVELAIGEIIMLMRRVFEKSMAQHNGGWQKSADGSYEIRGKTLGIIGYGNIGSQLSILAEAVGMNVIYYDVVEKLALGNAKKCNTLKELLEKSDVVSVHLDGRPENTNHVGENEFKQMKDGALFINLSRGFIVDIKALVKYLKNGKIAGAAIDVFPKEPKNNREQFDSGLIGMHNVILTPHIGGSTQEAQRNIASFVPSELIDFINSGKTDLSVNFPKLHLPELNGSYRLLHVHKNVPGILAKINSILASNGINIEGQYLKTNDRIGYVITDVNSEYDENVINQLKGIPDTIKFRILK